MDETARSDVFNLLVVGMLVFSENISTKVSGGVFVMISIGILIKHIISRIIHKLSD